MTLYFYDLETSGFNSRQGRIMQFAGQRTDMDLRPVGNPHNMLIKMSSDVVPDPDAVLITGITPQKTISDGLTEHEFLKIFYKEIATPNTIFVGYNTIRFDDEFMRHINYRNFYDPYEWQWQDGRSRWDLLDVVRMTRALRPEGIKWPFDSEGRPTNRLDLMARINKLEHQNAHDALSDVQATIELAKLIKSNQPKLFEFLLNLRTKHAVSEFVIQNKLFLYTSGKYSSETEKTTIVSPVLTHPNRQAVVVYDLRYNPEDFQTMTVSDLVKAWKRRNPEEGVVLPVKTMQYNRCPAIAPINVLNDNAIKRLKLNTTTINQNYSKLESMDKLKQNLNKAINIMQERQQERLTDINDVDNQLYDSFISSSDKIIMSKIRSAKPDELDQFSDKIGDKRLRVMLPLYKARNFSNQMNNIESSEWEKYRFNKLLLGGEESRLAKFFKRIDELSKQKQSKDNLFILEELKLYGESIIP